jgi:hypothetical protein
MAQCWRAPNAPAARCAEPVDERLCCRNYWSASLDVTPRRWPARFARALKAKQSAGVPRIRLRTGRRWHSDAPLAGLGRTRRMPASLARRSALLLLAVALAPPAHAQSLQVTGQAGVLGEWELSAKVTETTASGKSEFVGPLVLKHTGLCTQDGPEEKAGELRFQLSRASSRIQATLLIDGVACSYSARKSDAFKGVMSCPDRRDVPLLIWLK